MNHTSAPTESEQKVDMFWELVTGYKQLLVKQAHPVLNADIDIIRDIEENYVLVHRSEWEGTFPPSHSLGEHVAALSRQIEDVRQVMMALTNRIEKLENHRDQHRENLIRLGERMNSLADMMHSHGAEIGSLKGWRRNTDKLLNPYGTDIQQQLDALTNRVRALENSRDRS